MAVVEAAGAVRLADGAPRTVGVLVVADVRCHGQARPRVAADVRLHEVVEGAERLRLDARGVPGLARDAVASLAAEHADGIPQLADAEQVLREQLHADVAIEVELADDDRQRSTICSAEDETTRCRENGTFI